MTDKTYEIFNAGFQNKIENLDEMIGLAEQIISETKNPIKKLKYRNKLTTYKDQRECLDNLQKSIKCDILDTKLNSEA